MLAEAATAAVFAVVLLPLVLAEAATTAVFTRAPPPLVLAEAAAAAGFARAPLPLVLAKAAATAVFALALLPLVLAEAAAASVFTPAPPPLVLADAAATAVFALALLPIVLAEAAGGGSPRTGSSSAGGRRGRRRSLCTGSAADCVGTCSVAFLVAPRVPLSLLARRGNHCAAARRWGRGHRRRCAKAVRVRGACLYSSMNFLT